jgi:hypothetical protein
MEKNRLLELAGIEVKGVEDDNVKDKLVKLLNDNPKPSAEQLKEFSPTLVAELLASFLKKFKHEELPDEKFNKDELEQGVKIEQEHTDNAYIAKMIAKAHLLEIPDYYTRLKKMEAEADAEKPKAQEEE